MKRLPFFTILCYTSPLIPFRIKLLSRLVETVETAHLAVISQKITQVNAQQKQDNDDDDDGENDKQEQKSDVTPTPTLK